MILPVLLLIIIIIIGLILNEPFHPIDRDHEMPLLSWLHKDLNQFLCSQLYRPSVYSGILK